MDQPADSGSGGGGDGGALAGETPTTDLTTTFNEAATPEVHDAVSDQKDDTVVEDSAESQIVPLPQPSRVEEDAANANLDAEIKANEEEAKALNDSADVSAGAAKDKSAEAAAAEQKGDYAAAQDAKNDAAALEQNARTESGAAEQIRRTRPVGPKF